MRYDDNSTSLWFAKKADLGVWPLVERDWDNCFQCKQAFFFFLQLMEKQFILLFPTNLSFCSFCLFLFQRKCSLLKANIDFYSKQIHIFCLLHPFILIDLILWTNACSGKGFGPAYLIPLAACIYNMTGYVRY